MYSSRMESEAAVIPGAPLSSFRGTVAKWISNLRRQPKHFLAFFSTNLFGGLILSLLVSGRLRVLDPSSSVFMVSMLQWINLGVTVAKVGLDIYIYTAVTRNNAIHFDLAPFVLRFTIPAAALVGIVSAATFGFVNSIGCFVCIVLESISIILIAEKTARSQYGGAALLALLRFPLLAVCLFVMPNSRPLTVLSILTVTSLLRTIVAGSSRTRMGPHSQSVRYVVTLQSALLYPLNFLLFKSDQLALPFIAHSGGAAALAAKYAFLCKWPEVVSSVTSLIGAPLYPKLYCEPAERPLQWLRRNRLGIGLLAAFGLAVLAGTGAYVALWAGAPIRTSLIVPYALQAMLILPANLAAYSLLRADCLHGTLVRLGATLVLVFPLLAFSVLRGFSFLYAWTIPFQLMLFIAMLFVAPWGRPTSVYAKSRNAAL